MNRSWQMAALLLGLALASCGGNDKVTVQQVQQPPPPGSNPQQPIQLSLDTPAFRYSGPGMVSTFFQSNLPAGAFHLWVVPTPPSPINDPLLGTASDANFTQNTQAGNHNTATPPNSWNGEEVDGNLGTPGSIFARVYAETPTPTLNYVVSVLTNAPTGASIGSGNPAASGSPQAIAAGQTFAATVSPNVYNYFSVTAFSSGVHAIKLSALTGPSLPSIAAYTDPAFTTQVGFCWIVGTPPNAMGSCMVDAAFGNNIYFKVQDTSGSGVTYDISVIGP